MFINDNVQENKIFKAIFDLRRLDLISETRYTFQIRSAITRTQKAYEYKTFPGFHKRMKFSNEQEFKKIAFYLQPLHVLGTLTLLLFFSIFWPKLVNRALHSGVTMISSMVRKFEENL